MNLQDVTSHMSIDRIKIGCSKSFSEVNPLNIPSQTIHSGNTSLRLGDITNDIKQELQQIISVIKKASQIIIFKKASISTNCGIPVSVDFILVATLR